MDHVRGRVYALTVSNWDEHGKELCKLPGLRTYPAAKRVEGCIDAVALAEKIVSGTVPSVPEFPVLESEGLREYQARGVGFVVGACRAYGGAILADEMGLGKTLQAIAAGRELTKGGGRVYITCPAYLRQNWVDELKKWGETDVVALTPVKNKKTGAEWGEAEKYKWVVSSYDLGDRAFKAAFPSALPKLVIMDEAHYLTGRTSKRAKLLQDICALVPFRLALSGSPQRDRPRDLYQVLRLLFGHGFGGKFDFDVRYCNAILNNYGGLDNDGVSNAEELSERLKFYMMRRLKTDVASDLPALTRQIVWLDAEAKATRAFHAAIAGKSLGATYDAIESTLQAKLMPVIEACATAKKFVCFTWLRRDAHEIGRALAEDFGTPCHVVTGDLAADKRLAVVKRCEAEGCGLVATIDSMATGFNLQRIASQGFFHALDFQPTKMAQAEARLHRLGQQFPVQWTYFAMRDSFDELVIKSVVDKLDAHHAVMGDGKTMMDDFGDSKNADIDVLKELYDSL